MRNAPGGDYCPKHETNEPGAPSDNYHTTTTKNELPSLMQLRPSLTQTHPPGAQALLGSLQLSGDTTLLDIRRMLHEELGLFAASICRAADG